MQEAQEIIIFDIAPNFEELKGINPIVKSGKVFLYSMCEHCKPFYCEKCEEVFTPEQRKMMEGIKV